MTEVDQVVWAKEQEYLIYVGLAYVQMLYQDTESLSLWSSYKAQYQ